MSSSKLINFYLIMCTINIGCRDCLSFLSKNQYNSSLQISTTHGIIQGSAKITVKGVPYFSYVGIPFAQPPLGDLRFRSPQPIKPWTGVLDATVKASECVQVHIPFPDYPETDGNEDCLYLNIFTPQTKTNKLLPVIFWIYGGAFYEGSATYYGPSNLLDNGLVVVTFNYRLGMFGFLSTEDTVLPGNYGLKDQNAALRWTYQNIFKFGGDPNRITIAGQSAGACSVWYHMLSPKSKGLFSRAISMSGDPRSVWGYQQNPKSVAMSVAANLGIDVTNSRQFAEYLRKADSTDLKRANKLVTSVHILMALREGLPFTPTIEVDHEEAFITSSPTELIRQQKYTKVPVLMGMTTMEAGIFGKILNVIERLTVVFDISPGSIFSGFKGLSTTDNGKVGKRIRDKYVQSKFFRTITFDEICNFLSDALYGKPIMDVARALSPHTSVYLYVTTKPSFITKAVLQALGFPIILHTKEIQHRVMIQF
ncbi:esterase FE4-like isoform X2 [Diabrotica virgifera virgifera]|uniref:Carboxylic ester hydrolase n=1 Tax=Diabrotica virgifera virgifera TaxID=50390 RepID=A0ABM5K1Z5_DIAVI|nr:esterase FE4-like isoform X2 [Diabrotica virgifera virgifera]